LAAGLIAGGLIGAAAAARYYRAWMDIGPLEIVFWIATFAIVAWGIALSLAL
jgi:hypothetical protein